MMLIAKCVNDNTVLGGNLHPAGRAENSAPPCFSHILFTKTTICFHLIKKHAVLCNAVRPQ